MKFLTSLKLVMKINLSSLPQPPSPELTSITFASPQPLRVALKRLSVPGSLLSLIPDSPDGMYFNNMLKSLKVQAKAEATRYVIY